MFFNVTCYPDVAFHSPNEVHDGCSSCYVTSLYISTVDLKYEVNIVMSV